MTTTDLMERITSANFRRQYMKLAEPVVVVKYGKPVGVWFPVGARPIVRTPKS
jgi:hypothetical protein